jgi:hypothetical protein
MLQRGNVVAEQPLVINKMKKYFLFLLFGFWPAMVSAGYLREQGQYLQNFQVADNEVGSFEMFISLAKVTLAGVGLVLLLVILYTGLHWIFTYADKKLLYDSGRIFWGAVGALIGVAVIYVGLDFVFRILLLNKT